MSSKNFLLLLTLIILVACGVKGDPVHPKGSELPSLLQNYSDIKTDQSLQETKKR